MACETVQRSLESMSSSPRGNTPSLRRGAATRSRSRYETAMGSAEIASNQVERPHVEVQKSSLEMADRPALAQIRASMDGSQLRTGARPSPRPRSRRAAQAADPGGAPAWTDPASMNSKRGYTTAPADAGNVVTQAGRGRTVDARAKVNSAG